MNKAELIELVAEKAILSKNDAGNAVNAVIDGIVDTLKNGDSLNLTGFGAFVTQHRAERSGRNPQTGKSIVIPAATIAKFKPGKTLKDALNED